jgi:Domain of unknown function (DUF4394)
MRTRILLLAVVVLVLGAAAEARAIPFVVLTSTNGVAQFDSASPNQTGPVYPITGLQTNEQVYGIDFRAANGQLYGVTNMNRLLVINPASGAATEAAPLSMPLSGGVFGFDFDPASDRVRVISDSEQNILIDPVTGAVTVGPAPMYVGGSPNPFISGVAYGNNNLYAIDGNVLAMINPLDGVITPIGPLSGNPGPLFGFDVVDGNGYLAAGQFFDVVNLSNGSSAPAGQFPNPLFAKGLAAVLPAGGTPGGGTPGGGTPGGGLPGGGDFDLDGDVDLRDLTTLLGAQLGADGVTIRLETPAGVAEGEQLVFLAELLANFGRASAAQRGRAKQTVIARKRATLRGGQTKRVRVPLTRAGRRLYRGYTRKRLRTTLRLTVTYRPASGTAQKRTFKRKLNLRVKRPRR